MIAGPRSHRVPVASFKVPQVPCSLLRIHFQLFVWTGKGWHPQQFRLDTGASLTTMSAFHANQIGLSFPRNGRAISVETALGRVDQVRHFGEIRVRVPGWEGPEFFWPCHFVEQPDPQPLAALGLTGPLNDLKWTIDGQYELEFPYGSFLMEELATAADSPLDEWGLGPIDEIGQK